VGSAPSEVALAVSKVRHRACGDTRLDPKVKESTPTNTNTSLLLQESKDGTRRRRLSCYLKRELP